jgi:hypothetical protein
MTAQAKQVSSEATFGINEWQRAYALKTLEAYVSEVDERVLPAFGSASRAETPFPEEASDSDADPEAKQGIVARWYEEDEYRKDLEFAKSCIVEMAIAGLYHLWERRVTHLLRTYKRGLPGAGGQRQEMTDLKLGTFADIRTEFAKLGWDLESQEFYKKMNQLRLVTNAVKHGEGESMTRLWRKHPRLFWPYINESYPIPEDMPPAPTAAKTLDLSPEHFRDYAGALKAFWQSVPSLDNP